MKILEIDITFDKPYFYDIPPQVKTSDELARLLLYEANGQSVPMNKYSASEISRCARQLIMNGHLRGTVFGFEECAWSRITHKGKIFLSHLESANMTAIELQQ